MARGKNPKRAMSELKRAVSRYNSTVRKHNSEVRKFNREAKRFNRAQRANRAKLDSAIREHNRDARRQQSILNPSTTRLVRSYQHLQQSIDNEDDGGGLVDLAAGEAAASLHALAVLEGGASVSEDVSTLSTTTVTDELSSLSVDLDDRWRGALFSLHPNNPDAARHFCTSAREVIVLMIDGYAADEDVLRIAPGCELNDKGKPSRRAKLRYLVNVSSANDESVVEFADNNVEDVLGLFRTFNDGTHGRAGRFDIAKLLAIKSRVEGAILFLSCLLR